MFIATMYSYGSDAQCVGVDGIVGCMGLFLHHAGVLYAIHIPDTPNNFQTGRVAFVNYVNQQDPHFNGANARIYAVLNGSNRPAAYGELLGYGAALGVRKITTVRLRDNLGKQGSSQDSAAVLCELVNGAVRMKYMKAADVPWAPNTGTQRDGYYYNSGYDAVMSTSGALADGWMLIDRSNSVIAETN